MTAESDQQFTSLTKTKRYTVNGIGLLDVLTERKLRRIRCIVAEKRGGAVWRVRLYCNVKRSGKVIADLHLDSDQRQNLITSRGSPCTPCPCLPCLVDVRKRVRQLFCLQTE